MSVCLCVCRSASGTLNIAVNRSVPLPSPLTSQSSTVLTGGYQLFIQLLLVSACCVLVVLCVSSCLLIRRRRRRSAESRDPEVTSHGKMAPLCSNGKVATIHSSDKHGDNGHVCICAFIVNFLYNDINVNNNVNNNTGWSEKLAHHFCTP